MILHEIKKIVMRIGKNKGKTMYFASPLPQDRTTTRQVEDYIINLTSLSRSDIRSCITALAEVLRNEMLAGHAVDFADLGSFKLISTGKQVEKEKDVTTETLKKARVQFFPRAELRAMAEKVQRIIQKPDEEKPAKPKP